MGHLRGSAAAAVLLAGAAILAVGCSGSQAHPARCAHDAALTAAFGSPAAAAHWTLPGGNLQSTRDVASGITSANVGRLGVAWTVPITATGGLGGYATTPVVVRGVVYTQELNSDVLAIQLATGKVLWTHAYGSPDGGPNGVNVANGVVYAATAHAAVALQAATGRQLWRRTLIRNDHEEIDMAPGYHDGTVYLATAPVTTRNEYLGDGTSVLWALNSRTGTPRWSWDEVQDLWGKPGINSGGGQWYPPSFGSNGDLYIGVANPGPLGGAPGYPWGTSRPGPNLYTDSVVKLSPAGKLLWYYQLTPHDLFDWDLQDSPVLTSANGQPVVIDGGKAGILVELSAQTGKPLWRLSVGVHNGHDRDGLVTEHDRPGSCMTLPAQMTVEPGAFGGIESQLASNGTTTFAAVNNLPMVYHSESAPTVEGGSGSALEDLLRATGEVVAVNQDTGKLEWATKLPSSPYGAVSVTNNVVFTTTFDGDVWALNAATGAVLRKLPLSAGTNAPVTIDGDYLITAQSVPLSSAQHAVIVAYKLGGTGRLPAFGS